MVVMGIDPGYARLGYGLILKGDPIVSPITYGTFTTESGRPLPERLREIYEWLVLMIVEYKPDILAVEYVFIGENEKSIVGVLEARGIVLLAAAQYGIPVVDYTPQQIKEITGNRSAKKSQVQHFVKSVLSLPFLPEDDTADALAAALCQIAM